MALADRLREARKRSRMSLQEAADAVGASKAHIWDLEHGRALNPSIELLKGLSRAYKLSVADLIGENPAADEDESALVAMYRDLQDLSPADRHAIQAMMAHFRTRREP